MVSGSEISLLLFLPEDTRGPQNSSKEIQRSLDIDLRQVCVYGIPMLHKSFFKNQQEVFQTVHYSYQASKKVIVLLHCSHFMAVGMYVKYQKLGPFFCWMASQIRKKTKAKTWRQKLKSSTILELEQIREQNGAGNLASTRILSSPSPHLSPLILASSSSLDCGNYFKIPVQGIAGSVIHDDLCNRHIGNEYIMILSSPSSP